MNFALLILSLPTENATERMRFWRALKASGATVLRDGVYLMPDLPPCVATLEKTATEIIASGGQAYVFISHVDPTLAEHLMQTFDRSAGYAPVLKELTRLHDALTPDSVQVTQKMCRKLAKTYWALAETDFFPGPAKAQLESVLAQVERSCALLLSPNEPSMSLKTIEHLALADFQKRQWATRSRPYVDRLACAWLIRRFIDPKASFIWLDHPDECPSNAIGFDFDGAHFSHREQAVTFEVLVNSFALEHAGLRRMGHLVHYLDVGGVEPPEAFGVEAILAGLRETVSDDDALVQAANGVFNGLLARFEQSEVPT